MKKKKDSQQEMERLLADVLTEMPTSFKCGGKLFYIFPKSLGMFILINRLKRQLEFDKDNIKINPIMEAVRICQTQKDVVLRMLCYATKSRKDDVFDEADNGERIAFFDENLEEKELASLFLYIIEDENETIDKLKKYFKIDNEQRRKKKVAEVKNEKSKNISFGGVSIFGTILDHFCSRYGMTKDDVVWGISYINLMMMYYDEPDSTYISDDEKKKLPASVLTDSRDVIDPYSEKGKERIKNMKWE